MNIPQRGSIKIYQKYAVVGASCSLYIIRSILLQPKSSIIHRSPTSESISSTLAIYGVEVGDLTPMGKASPHSSPTSESISSKLTIYGVEVGDLGRVFKLAVTLKGAATRTKPTFVGYRNQDFEPAPGRLCSYSPTL